MVADRYGVSRPTVVYHLCSAYKEKQKKRPSKMWSYEKNNPIIHERRKARRAKYMAARRHIAQLVRESYRRAAPQEALTLGNLRDVIFEISGIAFLPSTLDGLIKRFYATKGDPLLVEVGGYPLSHYRLSEEVEK